MWAFISTAFMTAAVIFAAYGATAGIELRKPDVRKARIIRFSVSAVTGAIGLFIIFFIQ